MLYRLARDFQVWDVEGLAAMMDLPQFRKWVAFYLLEQELQEEARAEARVIARAGG